MDPVEQWSQAQERVIGLVESATPEELARPVPACPGWTAQEIVAHMIGVDADVLAGDEPEDHNDQWTQRQVDGRAGRSVGDLVAEWQELAGPLRTYLAEQDPRPLGDVIIHEQDLRGALRRPGARDTEALWMVRDTMIERFAEAVADQPTIRLQAPDWSWSSGEGEPAVVVEAGAFDLARAIISRRSEGQLREWTTQGDVGPYLEAFAMMGDLPGVDLAD